MSATGFNADRAQPHEEYVGHLLAILDDRGYRPEVLERDGDKPDIRIQDHHRRCRAYVDPKTAYSNQLHYSIKHGSLEAYWRLTLAGTPVYIVWAATNSVDTVFTLTSRIIGGPRRATGNGSRTDWMLIGKGGTPFNDWFVA